MAQLLSAPQAPTSRTKPCHRVRHSPSRTGPFTFRMMKRSVSRNFTRTCVTCRRRNSSLKMLQASQCRCCLQLLLQLSSRCSSALVLALELPAYLAARASPANDLHHNCELCWLVLQQEGRCWVIACASWDREKNRQAQAPAGGQEQSAHHDGRSAAADSSAAAQVGLLGWQAAVAEKGRRMELRSVPNCQIG